jgi:DNA-binding winged helix-turn-helix (wHTH) protein/Tol biopolymer transport system component
MSVQRSSWLYCRQAVQRESTKAAHFKRNARPFLVMLVQVRLGLIGLADRGVDSEQKAVALVNGNPLQIRPFPCHTWTSFPCAGGFLSGVLPGLIFQFGDFELDCGRFQLRRNGQLLRVERKPMELLILLASREGQLVSRGEIAERLWSSEVFVDTEHGINTAIRKLRHLLRDDAEEQRFIQTVTGMGYRFVAPIIAAESRIAEPKSSFGVDPATALAVSPLAPDLPQVKEDEPLAVEYAVASRTWKPLFAATVAALLLFALVLVLRRFRGESAASNPTLPQSAVEQRLTENASDVPVIWPAISLDGKYLAYADPTGLYLRHISSGETRRLNLPRDFIAFPPGCWYPDGVHLLVVRVPEPSSGLKPSIYKISILGGEPQEIMRDAWGGSVSPDGSRIAYLSPTRPGELWIMDSDGGNAKKVVATPEQNKQGGIRDEIYRVVWSPTGQYLAYIQVHYRYAPGPVEPIRSLRIVDLNGEGASVVLDDSRLGGALWWGAGNRILFSYREDPTNSQRNDGVYSIQIDERTRRAAGLPKPITRAEGLIEGMSGTADGKRLVVWRIREPAQAFLSDYDKETRQWSEPRRLILDANENLAYAWTADGKAVFFISNRNGTWKLFKQAIDETSPEVLVERRSLMTPRLSADGTHVLYMSLVKPDDTSSPAQIISMPIAGGTPRVVVQGKGIMNYQCATAPSTLCLLGQIDEAGTTTFRAFDLENGEGRKLLKIQDWFDNGNWSLSPDGSKVAMALDQNRIRFFSIATGEFRDVTVKDWPLAGVDWGTDSQTLFMPSHSPAGDPVILEVNRTGKAKVVLRGKPNIDFGWMIQSPDSRHAIVGEYIPTDNNAWIVSNNF